MTVTTPAEDMPILCAPFVLIANVLADGAERPEVVLPVKRKLGAAAVPPGNCKLPDIVSPALSTFNEALPVTFPVKFAVIVPAEKLPDASRATIAFAVFELVAVVAEFEILPDVEIVANLVSEMPAAGTISAFTISELDNRPNESL